jgi:hypothetical protein
MNTYHEANKLKWEARAAFWRASRDETGTWKTAHLDPGISFTAIAIEAFGDLRGKQA